MFRTLKGLFAVLTLVCVLFPHIVSAQSPIYFPGQTIHTIRFEAQTPDAIGGTYTADEVAAVLFAVNYWNDVLDTTNWTGDSFNGTVRFDKGDAVHMGGANAHGGSQHVSINESHVTTITGDREPQRSNNDLVGLLVHELGHTLGINNAGRVALDATARTITINSLNPWLALCQQHGQFLVVGQTYDLYNPDVPSTIGNIITFGGQHAREIMGDFWHSGDEKDVQVESGQFDTATNVRGTLAHPFDPRRGIMTWHWNPPPFLTELEMAMLQDIGHDIRRDRFYGRSFYSEHAGTITVDNGGSPFFLDGMFGIGLHLVAGNNTIVLDTDITTTGHAGAGIRIEDSGNTVIINNGIRVKATGEEGIGVLLTHQRFTNDTILINEGVIEATGENGTGVWFDANATRFDNYGTINAGINNAIYISENHYYYNGITNQSAFGTRVGAINFYGGSHIIGNIVSDSTWAGATYQTLSGRTRIDGNITIPNGTFQVANGSTLSMGTNTITANTVSIASGGTLAPSTGVANTFATLAIAGNLSMAGGSILQVGVGSNGTSSDKVNATGTVTTTGTTIIDVVDWTNGTYTILSANTFSSGAFGVCDVTLDGDSLNVRQTASANVVGNDLILTLGTGAPMVLTWTGKTNNVWRNMVTENWAESGTDYVFINGDSVIFDNSATLKSVSVIAGGVSVNTMTVSDAYTFTGGAVTASGLTTVTSGGVFRIGNVFNANGGTTVNTGGTLQIGNGGMTGSIVGNIANAGTVIFNRSNNFTFTNTLTGSGTVRQSGNGSVTLNGSQAGSLEQTAGTINLTGTWTGGFNQTAGTMTGNGTLTGNATFAGHVVPTGTLNVGGTATFNGATLGIDLGPGNTSDRIAVAGTVSSGGNSIINIDKWAVGTFQMITASSGIAAGNFTVNTATFGSRQSADLSGSTATALILTTTSTNANLLWTGGPNGNWNTTATGNWVDTATNAEMFNPDDFVMFTGAGANQSISVGSGVQVAGMEIAGGNYTFSGNAITGTTPTSTGQTVTGKLDITGGSATFNNAVGFVNGIEIDGGHAFFHSTVAASINVANGMLGGTGTIAGPLVVGNNATLSPGASIGTFTVNNDVVFESGSVYFVEIDKGTAGQQNDLLAVSGNVDIADGAELKIEFLNGSIPAVDDEFNVITAGSFTGELFTVTDTWALRFTQGIDPAAGVYWIRWGMMPPEFAENIKRFGTPNAIRAAVGMDEIFELRLTGKLNDLYKTLAGLDASKPQDLADAFAQLHGEVFSTNKEAAAQLQRQFQKQLPSAQSRMWCDGECIGEWHRWANFTGDYLGRKNIGAYSGYDLRTAGVAVGADRHITHNTFFGGAFGYDNAFQDFRSIRSQNQMDTFRMMGYGGWWRGNRFANAYVGYTRNEHRTRRNINIDGAFNAVSRGKYGDNMFSTGFEMGRELPSGLTPSFGLHYISLSSPSVTETGGGNANLHVYSGKYESLRMPMGTKWSYEIKDNAGPDVDMSWTPEVRIFYVRELADDSARVRTSFDGVRDVSFGAESGKWGRDIGRIGTGLEMRLASRLNTVNVRIDYDYEVYNHTTADTFTATLGVSW